MKRLIIVFLILSFCICLSCPLVFASEHGGGGMSFDSQDEDNPFAWNENLPVNSWNVCVYILRIGFVFGYKVLSELIMITEDVSAWDFIILCALVSGVLGMLAQSYGGGTSGSGSSADGALSKRNKRNSDE